MFFGAKLTVMRGLVSGLGLETSVCWVDRNEHPTHGGGNGGNGGDGGGSNHQHSS